jgi:hypothetical protein
MIMRLILQHLWRHIFQSTTKGIPLLIKISLHSPSKITYLDDVPLLDQNILGFDISVDESLLVHVVYARAGLYEEFESKLLG